MNLKSEQISGAVFLVGFGLIFITGWWFPGMLFVIGAASMAGALANNAHWSTAHGALWMIGLGLIFWLNLPWGVIFVVLGLSILFGWNQHNSGGKLKNEFKSKNDDYDIV